MFTENSEYKGHDLSEIEYEKIALDRVSGKLLASEAKLCKTAWFDYRMMHPTQRTYLFAHHYDLAYRYMLRLHVDHEQAEGDNPRSYFPKNDPLGKTKTALAREKKTGIVKSFKTTTSVWKARQKADELCIPYDVFVMSGMKAAIGQIWQRAPSPSQLYSQNIINFIIERWAELVGEKIFASTNEFYRINNWVEHPSQIEHAEWLIEQISVRPSIELALAQYGFIHKQIPPAMMKQAFDGNLISRAAKISKNLL